jgi:hypothetical protein
MDGSLVYEVNAVAYLRSSSTQVVEQCHHVSEVSNLFRICHEFPLPVGDEFILEKICFQE